ncbi:MAG: hypothetical protein ACI3Y3_04185, partial [Candidatus Cryptobacteroides sp.]
NKFVKHFIKISFRKLTETASISVNDFSVICYMTANENAYLRGISDNSALFHPTLDNNGQTLFICGDIPGNRTE